MSLTPEQWRTIVDAVATAGSPDALDLLRSAVRTEGAFEIRGGFLEVLIGFRAHQLAHPPSGSVCESGERAEIPRRA